MMGLALVLSVLIGISLGMLGGGGSILTTPILIYALGIPVASAIPTSLLVVGVTSLAGVIRHARAGNVVWRSGMLFGAAGMAGAATGGWIAQWIPAEILMGMFAAMMLVTSVAMFRGRPDVRAVEAPIWQIVAQGAGVGLLTGTVGAGGGFLIVPALVLLGGLPMQRAVGTSLLVIALNSAAGFAGHAAHADLDLPLAAGVTAAAVTGSVIGSRLTALISPDALRRGFAVFVLFMGAFVLYKQF